MASGYPRAVISPPSRRRFSRRSRTARGARHWAGWNVRYPGGGAGRYLPVRSRCLHPGQPVSPTQRHRSIPRCLESAAPHSQPHADPAGSGRERGSWSSRHARIAVRGGGHLIIEALLPAAPTREMDGDVGGYLDRPGQDLHDLAIYLLLLRGRQFEISRDGR
jgi:hypothetical protein